MDYRVIMDYSMMRDEHCYMKQNVKYAVSNTVATAEQ